MRVPPLAAVERAIKRRARRKEEDGGEAEAAALDRLTQLLGEDGATWLEADDSPEHG